MALTEKELLALKQRVDEAKTSVSELKGQQTALLKQLKADYGCNSIEEAEEKLTEYCKAIDVLERKISKGSTTLEKQLEKIEGNE